MAKATSQYICAECGYISSKWMGKCPTCGNWNTMQEQEIAPMQAFGASSKRKYTPTGANKPKPVTKLEGESFRRFSSGIDELDNVLGGGVVPASLVLIGGDPGVGKSTLLTEVCAFAAQNASCMYVSAEESCYQVKMRCDRLGVSRENMLVLNETNADEIAQEILTGGYALAVVDSVQAIYTPELSATAGSVTQIRECALRLMRAAKASGTAVFLVGHVTKEGTLAGPKVLEHLVDTVLYFEGENSGAFKILRAAKNRFGSTNEIGVFEMRGDGIFGVENPSELLLSENRGVSAGAVATATMEGSRCLLVELQALVSSTVYGTPRRMSLGIDYNRLVVILAVLEKRANLSTANQDVYVNAMGGIRIIEPAQDLAILLSVASALSNTTLGNKTAILGEVGLTGEVRAVPQIEKRVAECVKLGFERIILPKSNLKLLQKYKDKIQLIGVSHVYQAVKIMQKKQ
ncbi:MAG: DNA repair protein RadA [Clostridia bacterium]|nr:DNA repair protein RadA [Clostridia bacterium]